MGRAADALAAAQHAAALDPPGGGDPQLLTCKSYLYLGRYEDAVAACEKSAGLGGDVFTYLYLTAAYAQRGEHARAVAAREQVFKLWPNFALARWKFLVASDSPVYWQQMESHVFTGLRKAGVPEN